MVRRDQSIVASDDLALDGLRYDVTYTFVRREDLASFLVCGVNLKEDADILGRKYLVAIDPGRPAYLVLVLAPQHFAEEVDPITSAGRTASAWSVSANTSRFAVQVDVTSEVDYNAIAVDFASVLTAVRTAPLNVAPSAAPPPFATLLEAPTRLFLFPDSDTALSTAVQPRVIAPIDHDEEAPPKTGTGDIEIWSIDLTGSGGLRCSALNGAIDGSGNPKRLYGKKTQAEQSVESTLSDLTRNQLQFWSSRDPQPTRPSRQPLLSDSARFTTYGAQLNLRWSAPYLRTAPNPTMTRYGHRMDLGRTSLETLTYSGQLYPYGIPAIYITRISREPNDGEAQLKTHRTIQLIKPGVAFDRPDSALLAATGLGLSPLITPNLDTPFNHQILPPAQVATPPEAFFVYTKQQQPFRWHCVFDGFENTKYGGDTPAIFVLETVFDRVDATIAFDLIEKSWSDRASRRNEIPLGNQRVPYAPPASRVPSAPIGDPRTTLSTEMARYRGKYDAATRRVTPYLDAAKVVVPAVAELTGLNEPVLVEFAKEYKDAAGDLQGKAQAVLVPVEDLRAKFGNAAAETRNAVAAIQNRIIGVSREYGAIVGEIGRSAQDQLTALENGVSLKVSALFDQVQSRIFGLFPIADLLQSLDPRNLEQGLPTIVRQLIDEHTVEIKYEMSAAISAPPTGSAAAPFVDVTAGAFHLLAKVRAALDSHAPLSQPHVECSITGLKLQMPPRNSTVLPGALTIPVNSVTMISDGAAPRVSVDVGKPTFNSGVISLVAGLADSLGLNGDALRQAVSDDMISMQMDITLPSIPAGAINFYNIALHFALALPLDQEKRGLIFAFGLSSHRNPFTIAVGFLGGSGYMTVALTIPGNRVGFVGSLALSAAADLSFGPIEGSASFNAGLEMAVDGDAVISGYLNAWAAVNLFSIVSVSMSFEMRFAYDVSKPAFTGSVTVSVSVHVLFFSASADVTVSYTLGGHGSSRRDVAASSRERIASIASGQTPVGGANRDYWKRYAGKFA